MHKRIKIKLGLGFEPNERIITHYYNNVPFNYNELENPFIYKAHIYHWLFNRNLIITNYRVMVTKKNIVDLMNVSSLNFSEILGIRIEIDNHYTNLAIYSKNKGPIHFTFFKYIFSHKDNSYKFIFDDEKAQKLENIKENIQKIIKKFRKIETESKLKRKTITNKLKHEIWRRDDFTC